MKNILIALVLFVGIAHGQLGSYPYGLNNDGVLGMSGIGLRSSGTTAVPDSVPTVVTTAATSIAATTATLNGTVDANNSSTVARFVYGTTTTFGDSVTADESPITGTATNIISAGITGLTHNTKYYFKAVGSSSVGYVRGNLDSLTTLNQLDPATLSPLTLLYYDTGTFQDDGMATPATTGEVVGGWNDQSANNKDATQATAGNKPTRQAGGIQFTRASSHYLTFGTALGRPATYTVITRVMTTDITVENQSIVASMSVSGTNRTTWGIQGITYKNYSGAVPNGSIYFSFGKEASSAHADGYTAAVLSNNTFATVATRYTSGTAEEVWVDGVAKSITPITTTGDANTGTAYEYDIGRIGAAATFYLGGTVKVVAIWNTTLTEAQIISVTNWINANYP